MIQDRIQDHLQVYISQIDFEFNPYGYSHNRLNIIQIDKDSIRLDYKYLNFCGKMNNN